jgi:spore germination protein YaaH
MVSSGLYGPRRFDDYSDSPYLAYNGDDGWHQVWYTDWRLVLSRFNYGQSRGVAGIGFWALGYTAADVFAAAR